MEGVTYVGSDVRSDVKESVDEGAGRGAYVRREST